MRLRLVRASRRLPGPRWAQAIVVAWLAAITLLWLHDRSSGTATHVCLFRNLTDHPCPTCGGTRAAASLLEFRPLDALAWNPLATLTMVAAASWVCLRLLASRAVSLEATSREHAALAVALLAGVALNWWYVLWRGV